MTKAYYGHVSVEFMADAGRRNGLEIEHPATRELYAMSAKRCSDGSSAEDADDREKEKAYFVAYDRALNFGDCADAEMQCSECAGLVPHNEPCPHYVDRFGG